MSKSNEYRTAQAIPTIILKAIDHVRESFPEVDMVVFNDMGRWQFMGEDFERVAFAELGKDIDISLLEDASAEAYNVAGHPSVFQAYTSEEPCDEQLPESISDDGSIAIQ